jgi:phosphatidylglycerol:prolipoprotein diacylglycerol transferase
VYPELFHIGPFVIRSYGLMMALGFGLGGWWLIRRGMKKGLPAHRLLDLVLAIVISGLVGARLLFVITHAESFAGAWWRAFWPLQGDGTLGMGGFVFYGGLLTAAPVAAWLTRRWELAPLRLLDAAMPPLAFGTALGRIGCFLNGCCFGTPTDSPLGVIFPADCLAGSTFPGTPIHPTQLYVAFDSMLIVVVLLLLERNRPMFDGAVFGAYLILIGLLRSVEDLFRFYEPGMQLFNLNGVVVSVNHLISAGCIIGGIMIIRRFRPPVPDQTD